MQLKKTHDVAMVLIERMYLVDHAVKCGTKIVK